MATAADIRAWLSAHPNATDAEIRAAMDRNGVSPQQFAEAIGRPAEVVQQRYNAAAPVQTAPAQAGPGLQLPAGPAMARAPESYGQLKAPAPLQAPVQAQGPVSAAQIIAWLRAHPGASQAEIEGAMARNGITKEQLAAAVPLMVQEDLAAIRQQYGGAGANAEQLALQAMAQYAKQNNIPPEIMSQAAQALAPNPQKWTPQSVESAVQQYSQLPAPLPPQVPAGQYGENYGLAGAETALLTGGQMGLNQIGATQGQVSSLFGNARQEAVNTFGETGQQVRDIFSNTGNQVSGTFDRGIQGLSPFVSSGQGAGNLQAALSGALGPEAQKQAFAQYQQSPGVAFAQEEAERAILRNQAALGGLSGGNVRDELGRRAVGTFLQDFGNQFNRLGSVADRGVNAATNVAGLRGQEAGIQSNLGVSEAGIQSSLGQNLGTIGASLRGQEGGIRAGLGQYAASVPLNVGNTIGSYRFQAGRDIANSIDSTTSALSTLLNQQGAGVADIVGTGANNINSLFQQATSGDVAAKQQLATLLANISTGGASQSTSLPLVPGFQSNLLGQLGQVSGGIAGILQGLKQPTIGNTNPVGY